MSISAETHTEPSTSDDPRRPSPARKRALSRSRPTASDVELVVAAQAGDSTSYGQLYERYHPYICKILGEDINDADARHDILQTVFERGWTKLSTLRDTNAFRPWIAQLARRLVIDHYRTSSRTVATDFTDSEQVTELVSDDWSAHDWAAMRELASALQIGIDGLCERDAAVLELATTFGFTSQEIAAALSIDVRHARVLLHRARRRLSKELVENLDGQAD